MKPTKPTHGAYRLKSKLEGGKLDLRSSAGQAMKRLREAFHSDLGGDLTTAQKALVDRAITKVMIAELVETWTLKQATIISASGELPPVLKQNYLSWSAELRRDLLALGLDRRAKDLPNLQDYLQAKASQADGVEHDIGGEPIMEPGATQRAQDPHANATPEEARTDDYPEE